MKTQSVVAFIDSPVPLPQISDLLSSSIHATVVKNVIARFEYGSSGMLVLDKYYFRSNSDASLSVFYFQADNYTHLLLVPSGSATGLFRHDLGESNSFLNKAIDCLKADGWKTEIASPGDILWNDSY